MPYPSYAERPPKLIAGSLALDFLNTVEWRGDAENAGERLVDYDELVLWAEAAGGIDATTAKTLRAAAKRDPDAAAMTLDLAHRLRADLDAEFGFIPGKSSGTLDTLLRDLDRIGRLTRRGGRAHWSAARPADLRLPLLPVAVSAASLLVSGQRAHARACGDTRCGWVFLDQTPRQTRVWCQMEGCGNRAKARAHYARRHPG